MRQFFALISFLAASAAMAAVSPTDPFADLEGGARGTAPTTSIGSPDPFSGLEAPSSKASAAVTSPAPFAATAKRKGFFDEGFTFKRELYDQLSSGTRGEVEGEPFRAHLYSRQSIGFEALKKLSSPTATVGAFDVQARLVRRDGALETINDTEGVDRRGWFLEYHNLYGDLYNALDFLMGPKSRGENVGRYNLRAGRFYLPFGLNLQTDTHGTLLQLSNDRNIGFERDWYVGLWGYFNDRFNYDVYYMLGHGYDMAFDGQSGMLGARLSLSSKVRNEDAVEGGVSFLAGQRVSRESAERSPAVAARAGARDIIDTTRIGVDARAHRLVKGGTLTLATELSLGSDAPDSIFTQLFQADYLTTRRDRGASVQLRRFWQSMHPLAGVAELPRHTDTSLIVEATRYFRNDIGNAYLRWVKLNIERQLARQQGPGGTIVTVQYYRYW